MDDAKEKLRNITTSFWQKQAQVIKDDISIGSISTSEALQPSPTTNQSISTPDETANSTSTSRPVPPEPSPQSTPATSEKSPFDNNLNFDKVGTGN